MYEDEESVMATTRGMRYLDLNRPLYGQDLLSRVENALRSEAGSWTFKEYPEGLALVPKAGESSDAIVAFIPIGGKHGEETPYLKREERYTGVVIQIHLNDDPVLEYRTILRVRRKLRERLRWLLL